MKPTQHSCSFKVFFFFFFLLLFKVLPSFIQLREQKATQFPVLLNILSRSPPPRGGLSMICFQGCCIRA